MITVSYNKELDATIYTVEGDVVFSEVRDIIENYYNKGALTKYTIGDYSKANPGRHMTIEEAQQLGRKVMAFANARPNGFDLIVVPGILQHELANMFKAFAEITGKTSPKLGFKAFFNMEDAIAFIRQNEKSAEGTK
jgi:hypothetical protein